jgi:deoxycytidylate deaminase
MPGTVEAIEFPELIFGISGPIGVDMDAITDGLRTELDHVRYSSDVIKLTKAMKHFPVQVTQIGDDYFNEMTYKIEYANALCRKYDSAALARIAIREIRRCRNEKKRHVGELPQQHAYIIRQFKRPAEIDLMRSVYGRQFILVSAYGSHGERQALIENKIRRTLSTLAPNSEISHRAEQLIERDASEGDRIGQQLRDTFHLGDVFIDGISKPKMDKMLKRFIQALFGRNDIAPSKDEYGMYAAKSASLRSADLSRQIGAAIFSWDGELITQGCNEAPKAFGGTYWDTEEPDYRDIRLGYDPNEILKKEILRDILERLLKAELMSETAKQIGSPAQMVDALTKSGDGKEQDAPLVGAAVLDVTEYGRIVHAEMCAICDAATLGRSVKGATLFCTTFPCHNCTKHIVASGIRRVVYMEPYPKSKVRELHANEVVIEEENVDKVAFVPFIGISPFRYRDIFQKGRRKKRDGTARTWYHNDVERPMVDVHLPSYDDVELAAQAPLIGKVEPTGSGGTTVGNGRVSSPLLPPDTSTTL